MSEHYMPYTQDDLDILVAHARAVSRAPSPSMLEALGVTFEEVLPHYVDDGLHASFLRLKAKHDEWKQGLSSAEVLIVSGRRTEYALRDMQLYRGLITEENLAVANNSTREQISRILFGEE